MGGGQLGVANDTRAARAAVDPGEGHGTRLGPRLRLQTKVHRVFRDGACRVGWWLPRQMSTF